MSNTCQIASEVIPIEDDDDDGEDVEVVFTNLNKSNVYRNLMCQKISQEIGLLQAMCKRPVPNKFDEFKKEAKKLDLQYGDDVIQSAWQRIMKKYLMKLTSFPNNKAPICLVKPLQPSIDVSPSRATALLSSPHSSVTGPSSSPPLVSTAVPIALLLNKSIRTEHSPSQRAERFLKQPKLIHTIELDSDDINDQTNNANDSADEQVVSTPKSRNNQNVIESVSKNKVSIEKKSPDKRKSEIGDFSSNLDKLLLSKRRSEESSEVKSSLVNALSESYFNCLVSVQNRLAEKKKVSQKYSQKRKSPRNQIVPVDSSKTVDQTDKHIISASENRCCKTDSKTASKNDNPNDYKCSKKRRSETDVSNSDLHKQCLSKSGLEESVDIQNSFVSALFESCFRGVVSQQNHLDDMRKVTQKYSQKRKSSSKQVVPVDSPKAVDQAIAKSHVGVKAKIVRTPLRKRTSRTNLRKRISKTVTEMSEAELKEFKAEQKQLKYEEKRQFEMQQLQKVHDRLVDVLIPKYYNKNLDEKG